MAGVHPLASMTGFGTELAMTALEGLPGIVRVAI